MTDEHEERMSEFDKRMAEKKQREKEEEDDRTDRLRNDYLKRTGRKELKP